MLTYYLILGLPLDATDRDVRKRYLDLVRKYPPERDPLRFQKITEAYEALKDERKRLESKMFGAFSATDSESALLELLDARESRRIRVGLKELKNAVKKS